MKKLAYILCGVCCLLLASCATSPENIRERVDFGEGWRFQLGDEPQAMNVAFADEDWRLLNLPHDWAIEGDFSEDNPSGTGGKNGGVISPTNGTAGITMRIPSRRR